MAIKRHHDLDKSYKRNHLIRVLLTVSEQSIVIIEGSMAVQKQSGELGEVAESAIC